MSHDPFGDPIERGLFDDPLIDGQSRKLGISALDDLDQAMSILDPVQKPVPQPKTQKPVPSPKPAQIPQKQLQPLTPVTSAQKPIASQTQVAQKPQPTLVNLTPGPQVQLSQRPPKQPRPTPAYTPNPEIQPPLEFPLPEELFLEGATEADLLDVIDQLMERLGGIINEANGEIQIMYKQLMTLDEENFHAVVHIDELKEHTGELQLDIQDLTVQLQNAPAAAAPAAGANTEELEQEIQFLTQQNQLAAQMLGEKENIIMDFEDHVSQLSATINQLQALVEQGDVQLRQSQVQSENSHLLVLQLDEKDKQLDLYQQQIDALHSEITNISANRDSSLQALRTELYGEIVQKDNMLEALQRESQMGQTGSRQMEAENTQLKMDIAQLEHDNETHKEALIKFEENEHILHDQIQQLNQLLNQKEEEIHHLSEDVNTLNNMVHQKDEDIHHMNDLLQQKGGDSEHIHELTALIQQKDEDLHQFNTLLQQKEDDIQNLNSLFQQKDEEVHHLNTLLQQKEEESHGANAAMFHQKDEDINNLNLIVQQKEEDIHHLNQILQQKEEELHLLSEDVHTLNDMVHQKDEDIHHINELLQQKESMILELQQSQGGAQQASAELADLKNKLQASEKIQQSQNQEIATLQESLSSLQGNLGDSSALQAEIQELTASNQELALANQDLGAANQELTQVNQELADQNQDLATQVAELTAANQDLGAANQELGAANQDLGAENQALVAENQALAAGGAGGQMPPNQEEMNALLAELNQSRVDIDYLNNELQHMDAIHQQNAALQQEIQNLNLHIDQIEQSQGSAQQELQNQLLEFQTQAQTNLQRTKTLEQQILTLKDENEILQESVDQGKKQELANQKTSQNVQEYEQKIVNLQKTISQLEDSQKKLSQQSQQQAQQSVFEKQQQESNIMRLEEELIFLKEKQNESAKIIHEQQVQTDAQEFEIQTLKQQVELATLTAQSSNNTELGSAKNKILELTNQLTDYQKKTVLETEKYKRAISLLQSQKNEAEGKVRKLGEALRNQKGERGTEVGNHRQNSSPGLVDPRIKAHLEKKEAIIKELNDKLAYLTAESEALKETVSELMLGAGAASVQAEVQELKKTIAANERQLKAAALEKQIFVKKIEQLKTDISTGFQQGSQQGTVAAMNIKIRQLETEKETTDLKLKRLVAAVKVDRDAKNDELKQVKSEREAAEKKASELEDKLITFIELLEREKEKAATRGGGADPAALQAARQAMENAEEQIRLLQDRVEKAEQMTSKREDDLEKVKLALQKKVREIQTITDDLTQEKAKFERLLAATKSLKIENNRLQQEGASRSSGFLSNQNATKELDEAIERNEKLEAALKKLKQMLQEAKAEAADMQQSLQAKNRGLEVRLKTAEERARDAQLGEIQMNRPPPPSGPVMKRGGPPPPPRGGAPPPPKPTTIKINKTGQGGSISGPKGKPSNPGQQQMGDIVEAIKSGSFQLKKTTGPLQGEEKLAMMKRNDTDPAQNLAKMAQEVLLEKKRREREKAERAQAERAKQATRAGELENLLDEFGSDPL